MSAQIPRVLMDVIAVFFYILVQEPDQYSSVSKEKKYSITGKSHSWLGPDPVPLQSHLYYILQYVHVRVAWESKTLTITGLSGWETSARGMCN